MAMSRRGRDQDFLAAMGSTKIGLKATGSQCEVPDNPIAKLMYYLNVVFSLLKVDDDSTRLRKLRDYENWDRLTSQEENELLILCCMLSPDTLLNKILFIAPEMCGSFTNEIYELSAVRSRLLVSNNIVIGGKTQAVAKIMTVKDIWLKRNWIEPMENLQDRLQRLGGRQRAQERGRSCTIL